MTKQAGWTKSFSAFCKMLKKGLASTDPDISLDLLTAEDVNSLRGKNRQDDVNKKEKLYLILTTTSDNAPKG